MAEKGYRLSYKFRLYPTQAQEEYFAQVFGSCRFVYNYFLSERIAAYNRTQKKLRQPKTDKNGEVIRGENGKVIYEELPNLQYDPEARPMSYYDTSKALTALKKRTVDEKGHRWLYDVDATALVYALRHLEAAYQNFFRRAKQGKGNKAGFPKFKSRYNSNQSFTTGQIKVEDKAIILPKTGKVRAKIHREVQGKIVAATISKNAAGQYYTAISVKEADIKPLSRNDKQIGITMGLSQWVVTSNGEAYANPRIAKKYEKKLAREQRRLSRKVGAKKGEKPSKNYIKQRKKIARIHQRINNTRFNATHELTRSLVDEYGTIITREMSSATMMEKQNGVKEALPKMATHKMNRAIADANFAEINRQLAYKSLWAGRRFLEVPQDTPTAQTCSSCGYKHVLLAKNLRAEWTCTECGAVHSRKYNGAVNVLEAGMDILVGTEDAFVTKAKKQ